MALDSAKAEGRKHKSIFCHRKSYADAAAGRGLFSERKQARRPPVRKNRERQFRVRVLRQISPLFLCQAKQQDSRGGKKYPGNRIVRRDREIHAVRLPGGAGKTA